MNNKKLVKLVQSYPMLYDKKDSKFNSKDAKLLAWEEIGRILKVDGDVAMKRWNSIRQRFSKEIRNDQNQSGNSGSIPKQWALFDRLQFLKNHIIPRPIKQRTQSLSCESNEEELKPKKSVSDVFKFEEILPTELSSSTPEPKLSSSNGRKRKAEQLDKVDTALMETKYKVQSSYESKANQLEDEEMRSFASRKAKQLDKVDTALLETKKMAQSSYERKANQLEDEEIRSFALFIGESVAKIKNRKKQLSVMQRCTEVVMQAQLDDANLSFIKLFFNGKAESQTE